MKNSPLLGIGIAWFVFATVMRQQLGLVGIVFDAIYILAIAFFSAYLSRSSIVFLISLFVGNWLVTYFIYTIPILHNIEMSYVSPALDPALAQLIIFTSEYIMAPLSVIFSVTLAYYGGKHMVKRLKLRERVGKVINT